MSFLYIRSSDTKIFIISNKVSWTVFKLGIEQLCHLPQLSYSPLLQSYDYCGVPWSGKLPILCRFRGSNCSMWDSCWVISAPEFKGIFSVQLACKDYRTILFLFIDFFPFNYQDLLLWWGGVKNVNCNKKSINNSHIWWMGKRWTLSVPWKQTYPTVQEKLTKHQKKMLHFGSQIEIPQIRNFTTFIGDTIGEKLWALFQNIEGKNCHFLSYRFKSHITSTANQPSYSSFFCLLKTLETQLEEV